MKIDIGESGDVVRKVLNLENWLSMRSNVENLKFVFVENCKLSVPWEASNLRNFIEREISR